MTAITIHDFDDKDMPYDDDENPYTNENIHYTETPMRYPIDHINYISHRRFLLPWFFRFKICVLDIDKAFSYQTWQPGKLP